MNEADTNLRLQIDRYADGELSADQLTELLRRCDSSASWKLCALTLMESRETTAALREMLAEQDAGRDCAVHPPCRRVMRAGRPVAWVCAVATLCLAFVAGRWSTGPAFAGPSHVVESDSTEYPAQRGASYTDSATGRPKSMEKESMVAVVGVARIHRAAGSGPAVPVIGGSQLDVGRLIRQPVPVPDDLRRRAGNLGLQLKLVRQVVSLELVDGQRLAFPLDSVGVRYIGPSML